MNSIKKFSNRSLATLLDHLVGTVSSLKIEEGKEFELKEIQELSGNCSRLMAGWIESISVVSYLASNSEMEHPKLLSSLGATAEIMGELAILRDVLVDIEKEATDILNGGD